MGNVFKSVLTTSLLAGSLLFGTQFDQKLMDRMMLDDDSPIETIIHLQGQFDLSQLPTEYENHEQRVAFVRQKLMEFTLKQAAPVKAIVELEDPAKVPHYNPIWITNSIELKAAPSVIEKILGANGIRSIQLNEEKAIGELGTANASLLDNPDQTEISWGVEKVRAPEMWEAGIDGTGVRVAVIDTGVHVKHPDVEDRMWQNPGESGKDENGKDKATNGIDDDNNGFVDDIHGWSFRRDTADLADSHGHGSKVAGVVAGTGLKGKKTGVAPGATIIGIAACCGKQTKLFESDAWESMQYAIQSAAHVISMSLSVKKYSNPSHEQWRRASEVMLAAGVVHANSAGNRGSSYTPFNVGAPCSNPPAWLHPMQAIKGGLSSMITVGATDQNDKLRSYSSTGPVGWMNIGKYDDYHYEKGSTEKTGLTRPDVCGPSQIPTISNKGEGYVSSFGGTSSATPVVAGVATLLLSAKPELIVAQITETLMMSAVKIGSDYNNQCGGGRIDAVAALEYANEHF